MLVYRVEHVSSGIGPYNHTYDFWWFTQDHCALPAPINDGIRVETIHKWDSSDKRHGFESIAKLRSWFSHAELIRLSNLGFHVVIYDTAEYLVGFRQVVFKNSASLRITAVPINFGHYTPELDQLTA